MKKALAIILSAIILILPAACNSEKPQGHIYDAIQEVTSPITNPVLHAAPSNLSTLQKVASSGIIELYSDPKTHAVSVRETMSGQYWHSLPPYVSGYSDTLAPITLTVLYEGTRYHWNVQENSVAFGRASTTKLPDDTGIEVVYNCYLSAEEAANPMPSIIIRVTVRYLMLDGSFIVRVGYENLTPWVNAVVEEIGVLESFGAYGNSTSGDFILVPDGSGAIINTARKDSTFAAPLSFKVYGADPAIPQTNYSHRAILPVFGIRYNKSGFAAYIEEGDALATITADRQREGGGLNRVGARFVITPTVVKEHNKNVEVFYSQLSYDGEILIRYRFLSAGAADYSGMAGALREQLSRAYLIPTQAIQKQDQLPLSITMTATARVKNTFERSHVMTDAAQMQEFLSMLKGKGIDNAILQYMGATTRSPRLAMLYRVGGAAEFGKLQDMVRAQNMQLALDIPYLTGTGNPRAEDIFNKEVHIPQLDKVSEMFGATVRESTLRGIASLDSEKNRGNVTQRIVLSLRDISPMALSLSDLNTALSSDHNHTGIYNRQQAANEIREQLYALSTGRKLTVPGGNFYLLHNASMVTDLPSRAFAHSESKAYVSVPLVQMLLHGVVDYSFAPLNFEENPDAAFLKAIEYGALPAFSWISDVSLASEDVADRLDYHRHLNYAAQCSERATHALADLRGSRIRRHTIHSDGVTSTEYEGGEIIYVNVTNKNVKLDNLTIPAMDFLRIN
ncbi:MAG: DUF5696 domain-containing protein [Oscillospiraceae bacterium]|nr:DUF5696 domain-containing protein [Oscillospiraceae bacterium]